MDIAIPRAWQPDEQRVALTPAGVQTLISAGHTIYVEHNAGLGSAFTDDDYNNVGAHIVYSPNEIYGRGDFIATIRGVPDEAMSLMRPGQIIGGFLHLAVKHRRTLEAFADAKLSTVSLELIRGKGGVLPVRQPISEITGRLLPQLAAHLLETPSGGRGILLVPVPGIPSAEVVIVGAGVVGVNAAYGFTAWGVQTTVLDNQIERLRRCERICRGRVTTRLCTDSVLESVLPFADVLIGAAHIPGDRTPKLVSRDMVKTMKPHSVIIDVAINQGGCIETSRPTSHHAPTYMVEDVLHYAVPNITSGVARTATHALNNALTPYLQKIADAGLERAITEEPALAHGVGFMHGQPIFPKVAEALGVATASMENFL